MQAGKTDKASRGKWYAAGLAFECQRSGNCCSGEPGFVWVTKADIRAIAKFLGRPDEWLDRTHLRRVGFRYSLTEQPDGDCIFLERSADGCSGCKIHPVKPIQCQTWPFWTSNLRNVEAWNEAARGCPGINRGPVHSFVRIENLRLKRSST